MAEKYIPGKQPDQQVVNNIPEPVNRTFNGISIGGVFMAPRQELADPNIQADLLEKIDRMRKHLS